MTLNIKTSHCYVNFENMVLRYYNSWHKRSIQRPTFYFGIDWVLWGPDGGHTRKSQPKKRKIKNKHQK